jgi:hypothetical protein
MKSKIQKFVLIYVSLMALTAIAAFADEGSQTATAISADTAAVEAVQKTEQSSQLHKRVRSATFDLKRNFIESNTKQ